MCGIAGYWTLRKPLAKDELHSRVLAMTQSLKHRGPDSGALWLQPDAGLALGHRRLAIRDLSPAGHQPMTSPDGRFVISYNGEIYNTDEIKQKLKEKDIVPAGSSDTEALLLACMALGLEAALECLQGMYAFALWDRRERRLTLVGDRFGVKPLYWTLDSSGRLLFASELKAFRCLDDFQPEIDVNSLGLLLRYSYIPAPYSIWKNVYKLPPASRLDLDTAGIPRVAPYWEAYTVALNGLDNPLPLTDAAEKDYIDELDNILTEAVKCRMVSDVPIGAFLSGGIDSSLVTALIQKSSSRPVRTFSIGFEEEKFNEAPFALAVAKHLGTDHCEMSVSAKDAYDLIPQLPEIYDEPFADSSQIPTTLLCRLTRRHVATALSGDGGDEFFAGYRRYPTCLDSAPDFHAHSRWHKFAASAIKTISPHAIDVFYNSLPGKFRKRNMGSVAYNYAEIKLNGSFAAYYDRFKLQHWWQPATILKHDNTPDINYNYPGISDNPSRRLGQMQLMDTLMYLPGDILTKVDRASMSCSLENRVPLLDTRVYAFACRIPQEWRVRKGHGKYLLHKILHKYVPPALVERPKMGFGIPVGEWIKGPLRSWAEDLLSKKTLDEQGFFRSKPVREAWQRHVSGISNYQYHLWSILMFQTWLKKNSEKINHATYEPLPAIIV